MASSHIFEVLEIYGSVSLQGQPSTGKRHFGVPPGGAFDLESHALANALVGNAAGACAIELAMARLVLKCLAEGSAAWVGAGAPNAAFSFKSGDRLELPPPKAGCRSYLALPGGIRAEALTRGSKIASVPGSVPNRRLAQLPSSLAERPIGVVRGPQSTLFPFEAFVNRSFAVARELDRVGVRLSSLPDLSHNLDLPSDPACIGTIQITPNGTPIILGPDGPTIGGYPKIAVVPCFEIPRIAQLSPGQSIQFKEVDLVRARQLTQSWQRALGRQTTVLSLALA